MQMTFATISSWMRLNLFSRDQSPAQQPTPPAQELAQPRTGRTFPADEVVWGIVIRNGFDELDDPWYHRGTTQHAYLEGHDHVALCGFRPPLSGPRTRRRARLGLPTDVDNPMCGICARMVVAPRPRPRVPVPIGAPRPAVAIAVSRGSRPVAAGILPAVASPAGVQAGHPKPGWPVAPGLQPGQAAGPLASPWVRRSEGRAGLMARGVHTTQRD